MNNHINRRNFLQKLMATGSIAWLTGSNEVTLMQFKLINAVLLTNPEFVA
jgi:hypothetical protein